MTSPASRLGHILLALVPVLVTPALVFAVAEGWLNFGGGEKDLVLAIPYVVWALVFAGVYIVLILKRWSLRRWINRSLVVSIGVICYLAIVAFLTSSLGIA